ncbi:MAG: Hsp33 family molecular chaperone HslO [Candidatus Lambdaproteobacteria bacterium]|nr:Hsp33 family molecular chaperone HslO [Candidatus Lambdaproteobacteria bacterium]
MADRLIRGTFPAHHIRFAACEAAALCSESIARHHADQVAGWLLSEALTCAALLSVELKHEQRLTLRWLYPGPVGTILADLNERGEVRGFAQRLRLFPEVTTLSQAIGGSGQVSGVTSWPNRVGRKGITQAVFRDVSRDLAHFLSLSFGIESALVVGLNMPPLEPLRLRSAVGLLLQPLPGCDLTLFDRHRRTLEQRDFQGWLEAAPRPLEAMLERLGIAERPQLLGETEPSYRCQCSREKVESVLRMIEPEELRDMRDRDGKAEVNCQFCATTYVFSRSDLSALLRESQVGNA